MALRSGFARLLCKQADAGLQLTKQAHSVALVGAPLSRGQVGSAAKGGEAPLAPPREQAGAAAARLGSARLASPRRGWLTRPPSLCLAETAGSGSRPRDPPRRGAGGAAGRAR